eukprot:m.445335 g.445335  ORF g.445335 m.445335 type:complete len:64 (-) comp19214_c0_seq1:638-829(-)
MNIPKGSTCPIQNPQSGRSCGGRGKACCVVRLAGSEGHVDNRQYDILDTIVDLINCDVNSQNE